MQCTPVATVHVHRTFVYLFSLFEKENAHQLKPMSTTTLVRDLQQIERDFPETRELAIFDKLKEDAKSGVFHDFKSDLDAPKLMLRVRIQEVASVVSGQECKLATTKLARKVVAGDYDDECDEEQKAQMDKLVASLMSSAPKLP